MAKKEPFDNASSMRQLFASAAVVTGVLVAGALGVRSFLGFGGGNNPAKAPEAIVAVDGGVEIGSMDKNTNTLTIRGGTNIEVMAPGHIMLRDTTTGKTSKDMFFKDQLNVKVTGPAGNVGIIAYADVANSRGSTIINIKESAKGHNIVVDATRVPISKMAMGLYKGEGNVTFSIPQPMDATGLKTSSNPKGIYITDRNDLAFLMIGDTYKGTVSVNTPRGLAQVTGVPHNQRQDRLKEIATPIIAPPAPAVVPPGAGAKVDPAPAVKVDPAPAVIIDPAAMPKAPPTPDEKLAQSKLEVRAQQQKVIEAAQKVRTEVMDARQINRNIIVNNPRINEYTRGVILTNYDTVTRNIQGNFDVWIGKMQLEAKGEDITAARQNLTDNLGKLKEVEAEFRGNKAEVDRIRKDRARAEAKATLSPLSATNAGGNNYTATVRSFGENSTITISPKDVYIQREDGKDTTVDATTVKNPKAQFTGLKITEPGSYDIIFKGTVPDGFAFQITSTHKKATIRVHYTGVENYLSGDKARPIEIRAAGEVIVQTPDAKPEKLEFNAEGKNKELRMDSKPLIKVVEPKSAPKLQEGPIKTSALTPPVDGFDSLVSGKQERATTHAGRLERSDFGIV